MNGPENSSSAGYRAACFHRSRPVLPAGLSFAFAGRGELLMLLLPFKAMLPLGHARKSGSPPLFEPSFKVQRENAHNQSSGFTAAPGLEGLNARGNGGGCGTGPGSRPMCSGNRANVERAVVA